LNPEKRALFLNLDLITSLADIIYNSKKPSSSQVLLPQLSSTSIKISDDDDDLSGIDSDQDSETSMVENLTQTPNKDKSAKKKLDLKLAIFLVNTLVKCGVKAEDIGVITPLNYEKNYI
jgi:hypothetical protein